MYVLCFCLSYKEFSYIKKVKFKGTKCWEMHFLVFRIQIFTWRGGGGEGRITPYPLPPTCVPKTHNPQISKHKLLEILFSRRIRCEVCTRTEEKAAAFLGKLHKNLLNKNLFNCLRTHRPLSISFTFFCSYVH